MLSGSSFSTLRPGWMTRTIALVAADDEPPVPSPLTCDPVDAVSGQLLGLAGGQVDVLEGRPGGLVLETCSVVAQHALQRALQPDQPALHGAQLLVVTTGHRHRNQPLVETFDVDPGGRRRQRLGRRR